MMWERSLKTALVNRNILVADKSKGVQNDLPKGEALSAFPEYNARELTPWDSK